jgi:hypothetical protein
MPRIKKLKVAQPEAIPTDPQSRQVAKLKLQQSQTVPAFQLRKRGSTQRIRTGF